MGGHAVPADFEAVFLRELPDEKSLDPPIPLAEGVGGVDFTEVMGESFRPIDRCGRFPPTILFSGHFDERFGEIAFDVKVRAEATAAFGHVHGAGFTRPRINILEQLAVDFRTARIAG